MGVVYHEYLSKTILSMQKRILCWIIRQLGNKAAHGDNVQFFLSRSIKPFFYAKYN